MNEKYKGKNIIGADETGVGDYLTPLVAAAVFVPYQNVQKLTDLGVIDSKKISDFKIITLAQKIKPIVKSSVSRMSQAQYNFLTQNKKYNAHVLKTLLHLKCINYLESIIDDVNLIIIDEFASEENFAKYSNILLKEENLKPIKNKTLFIKKGESEHVAVAAASILARAELLSLMQEQEKKWNCKFPLGTNLIVEQAARDFIKKNSMNDLYQVAKLSFKTTNKL